MRIVAISLLAAAFLGACATTPAERAAEAERDVDRIVQVYGSACEKLGYTSKTDPWRNCLLNLNMKDEMSRYNYYDPYPYWYGRYGHRYYW